MAKLKERLPLPGFIPRGGGRKEWHPFGAEVKTTGPFRANLVRIFDRAAEAGTPVLFGSFAHYLPEGYSLERFEARELDYGSYLMPIEVWGEAENVVRATRLHNRVLRALAAERSDVVFVDVEAALRGDAAAFDDFCHLSEHGVGRFVDLMAPAAARLLAERP